VFLSVFLPAYLLSRRSVHARQKSQQVLTAEDERDKAEKEIIPNNHITDADDDDQKEITSQQVADEWPSVLEV
jgi:hypothetical protein